MGKEHFGALRSFLTYVTHSSTMRYALTCDVGGTNIRVALASEEGEVVQKLQEPVGADRGIEAVLRQMKKLAGRLEGGQVEGVGVGFPGIIHPEKEMLYQSPHFPQWRSLPLGRKLRAVFGERVIFDNDANMAAEGERVFGAGKNLDHFIVLTLGTGIGGGIVLNREVWRGQSGFAGEVGHMTIHPEGPQCACGKKGCWEVYAASQFAKKGETPLAMWESAKGGAKEAIASWKKYGTYLAIGIANLAHILDIEHYILGGGIAAAKEFFLPALNQTLEKRPYETLSEKIVIHFSTLKGNANLLGAAARVFKK